MVDQPSVSSQLVSHAGRFRDSAWDAAVLRRAQLCLLDSLASYSAGRSLKHFTPSLIVASHLFGIGSAESKPATRLSPFALAYLYGQAANALDYDDCLLIDHPGAPIVGAVLAIAGRERLSTDRLLRGIVAGYDVALIMGAAAMPSQERAAQVRSVGIWDTVAASIGAGVALGLDDQALERLLGVALTHSLLPYTAKWYERPAPAVKNNMGWAAAGAVLSVDLAREGQTGVANPLDGDTGMWRMAGSDGWNWDKGLLSKPGVLRTGFKPYPVCWHLQQYHKVLADLLATKADGDDIVSVVVTAPQDTGKFCPRVLHGSTDMATSLPHTFSLLIAGVEPGPAWGSSTGHGEDFRYADLFRYELSNTRSVSLHTQGGCVLTREVSESDLYDRSQWGLDEAGVLAKFERLADAELIAATTDIGGEEASDPAVWTEDDMPAKLYAVLENTTLNDLSQIERAGRTHLDEHRG